MAESLGITTAKDGHYLLSQQKNSVSPLCLLMLLCGFASLESDSCRVPQKRDSEIIQQLSAYRTVRSNVEWTFQAAHSHMYVIPLYLEIKRYSQTRIFFFSLMCSLAS